MYLLGSTLAAAIYPAMQHPLILTLHVQQIIQAGCVERGVSLLQALVQHGFWLKDHSSNQLEARSTEQCQSLPALLILHTAEQKV
jgi:hypothetical protein